MPDFLESELPDPRPDRSLFHVIPIPLEASVSYGRGTAMGPRAILEASQQLEAWDGESTPLELGIHTTEPVECTGDITRVLTRIEIRVGSTVSQGSIPVLLGGEHTVTLGALRAIKAATNKPFGIVQFDAHADLRDEYQKEHYSHACVMRRMLEELNLPLFQIGVRALSKEEQGIRSANGISYLDASTLFNNGIPETILPPEFPESIYITFDVDAFDPSVIRATGCPVPGGLGWYDTLLMLEKILSQKKLIGFDVVELAPVDGDIGSDFTAAQLVYSIMGIFQRRGCLCKS